MLLYFDWGGKEANGVDDLVLEVKEVCMPIPAYFLPYKDQFWTKYEHQGKRVVATQKAMHHLEDPYLGYITIDDRHFYFRERSPYKKKVKADQLMTVADFDSTLEIMGKITAKIHAHADADFDSDLFAHHSEVEILKAIGRDFETFSTQIVFTAIAYKEQANEDYVLFCDWVTEKFDAEKQMEFTEETSIEELDNLEERHSSVSHEMM